MLYKKGDAIEIEGVIALVLEDGMSGVEFYNQHAGTEIALLAPDQVCYPRQIYENDKSILENSVWTWHYVLIGDVKGWHGIIPSEEKSPLLGSRTRLGTKVLQESLRKYNV